MAPFVEAVALGLFTITRNLLLQSILVSQCQGQGLHKPLAFSTALIKSTVVHTRSCLLNTAFDG